MPRRAHGWLAILSLSLAVLGCQTRDPADPNAEPPARLPERNTKGGGLGPSTPIPPPTSTNTTSAVPTVLPTSGRIHSVNTGLRFVVIDYTLGGMPAMGSRLNVYRNNEKVGEIRLSGPEPRNGFVTADVVEGYLQPEDEVRVH